jgi:uncharacterized protein DUF6515
MRNALLFLTILVFAISLFSLSFVFLNLSTASSVEARGHSRGSVRNSARSKPRVTKPANRSNRASRPAAPRIKTNPKKNKKATTGKPNVASRHATRKPEDRPVNLPGRPGVDPIYRPGRRWRVGSVYGAGEIWEEDEEYDSEQSEPAQESDQEQPEPDPVNDLEKAKAEPDNHTKVKKARPVNPHDNRYNNSKEARRDYHHFTTVNHLIITGKGTATRPQYSTKVIVAGGKYYYWGGVYYRPYGSRFTIVNPPAAAVVYSVPKATTVVSAETNPYLYYGGVYYIITDKPAEAPPPVTEQKEPASAQENGEMVESPSMVEGDENYEVVVPPIGAIVPYLPDEAVEKQIKDRKFLVYEDTFYEPFSSNGEIVYQVIENPEAI